MLQVQDVTVRRGGVDVVRGLDLSADRGEVVALLGPSGAGKSSLLLAVAGLVPVAAGRVMVGDRDVTRAAPHRRGVGMVFQEYALFPHMTVGRNVAYGLHGDGTDGATVAGVVDSWLTRVGLAPDRFRHRDVATLSGGQRQRVALARSLAPAPPVLLLDEPLGALDRQLREELLGEIDDVVHAVGGPAVVVVTHDRDEAFTLGDRVGVMRDGRLVQLATPTTLWSRPVDEWTARFLGHPNVLGPADAATIGLTPVPTLLPAHAVAIGSAGSGSSATVVAVAWRDGARRVTLDRDGVRLVMESRDERALADDLRPGDELPVRIDRDQATALASDDRRAGPPAS